MTHQGPFRFATLILSALLAALAVGPVAAHSALRPIDAVAAPSIDLAPSLTADGTFRGAADIAGAVDASAWSLVSDLASGDPPRFVS